MARTEGCCQMCIGKCIKNGKPEEIISQIRSGSGEIIGSFNGVPKCHEDVRDIVALHSGEITETQFLSSLGVINQQASA